MTSKRNFAKNFAYTFSSNIVSLILNAIILMIVPKVITTTEYGYFQYYIMVVGYTIYCHFGWVDGIYLRYSGQNYEDLNKNKLSSQFKYLILFSIFQCVMFSLILHLTPIDINKKYAIFISIIAILFVVPKTFTYVLMQATSRFKEYSRIIILEKLFFGIILVFMIETGIRSFSILIWSDLIGKAIATCYGCYCCFEIIKARTDSAKESISELSKNIKCGIFIMIANISSVLITGIVQLVIESRWSIETFGKVSLTFNISKTILVVINAVGIIIFPMLKRVSQQSLPKVYVHIRALLLTILFIFVFAYYPLAIILEKWLPQYGESVKFMAILFPMCIFESKTSMLLNTYYKLMRKERQLSLINSIVVVLSLIFSIIAAYILNNLYISVLVILVLLAIRSTVLELYITKCLDVLVYKDILIEIIIVSIFVAFNSITNYFIGGIVYLLTMIVYFIMNKKTIINAIHFINEEKKI